MAGKVFAFGGYILVVTVSGTSKVILWTGKRHSGKTTSAFKLAELVRNEGFTVAGLLAFSLSENGRLVGFDAFDLQSENRAPLVRREIKDNEREKMYLAPHIIAGFDLGRAALSLAATKSADLIIIDEFGPLELDKRGWRKDVDLLLALSNAIILLVVRQELVNTVRQLYKNVSSIKLIAGERDSFDQVVSLLRNCRQKD
jgi:nucleoside-triphosphatase THEP1